MPKKSTVRRARVDKRQGKSASTQAGEFVREEIESIRRGEHGARSAKQAIAIGLSKARRAGVKLKPPKPGEASEETIEHARQDIKRGKHPKKPNRRRSRATLKALKREGTSAASHEALSRQAKSQTKKRTASERSAIAKKAARTRKRRARA